MKLNKNEISMLQRRAGIKRLTEGELDQQDLGREHAEWMFLKAVNDLARGGYSKDEIIKLIDLSDEFQTEPDPIDLYPGNMGDEMSAPR